MNSADSDTSPDSQDPATAAASRACASSPPPRRKKNRGWILWVVVIVLALGLGISILVNFGLAVGLAGGGGGMSTIRGHEAQDEFPTFIETHSWGSGKTKVIRMKLSGAIFRGELTLFGPGQDKVEALLRQIRAATNDKNVRGIIFEVNSPGGAVTPSDEIYSAFKRFKASDPKRVVVVHMRDLAASGGYYASMASDHIIAEPTTVVGSIGVIMQSYNFQKLAEKVGVTDTTIKSGPNKDLLNPFREVDPEDVALLQEMVDAMQQRFVSIVQSGRNLPLEDVRKIADGRVLTSEAALKNKLIDEIGYWEDAVAATEKKIGSKIRVFKYQGRPTFIGLLSGAQAKQQQGMSLLDLQFPRMLYLYRP